MKLVKILTRKQAILYVLIIVFVIGAIVVSYQNSLSVSSDEKYKYIQADFLNKEELFDKLFAKLTFNPRIKTTVDLATFYEDNNINSKDFIIHIYQDSVLSAWSSSEITPFDYIAKADTATFQYVDNKCVYVKKAYYFTNKYIGYIVLNDEKEGIDYLPLSAPVAANAVHSYIIKDNDGNDAFRLVISKELKNSDLRVFLTVCLWLITFSLFCFALMKFLERITFFKSDTNRLFLILVPLLLLFIQIFFSYIRCSEDLFSSKYYSFSGYGSLGELFIYSYLAFFLATFFMQHFSTKPFFCLNNRIKSVVSILFIFGVLWLNLFAYQIVKLIASDSFIVLNPEMIYQYNVLSITAIVSIVLILWTVFIFTYKTFLEMFRLAENKKTFFLTFLAGLLCITVLVLVKAWNVPIKSDILISYFLFVLLFVLIIFFIVKQIKWNNILFQCFAYLILSGIVFYSTKQTVEEREEKYKESISERMLSIQDPFVFYSFSELAQEILSDNTIVHFFDQQPYNATEIERYIVSTYLGKYTGEYRISIETGLQFSIQDSLRFGRLIYDNYATDRISSNDRVSFRSIGFGKSEYMLNLPFPQGKNKTAGQVFILFRSYILSEEQAYMEESIQREMANYSYAGYENNSLKMSVNQLDIPYLHKLSNYKLDTIYSGMKFIYEDVEHTAFKHNAMTLLVSVKKGMTWGKLSFVILLFFILFIFSLIPFALSSLWESQRKWIPGFQDSMQFYATALVAITIITSAILFSRFFINLRNFDKMEIRNQMANKVKDIITKSVGNSGVTNLTSEIVQSGSSELEAFFNIDLLDLNLYNRNGELIKSYGKAIYISSPMNPFVLKQFSIDKYGAVTVDEEFGKEKYKSLYRTITGGNGEVVGYLDLLSFSEKQADMLDPRHAQFLAKSLIICLLTTLLIIFFSMFFIRKLMRPLSKVTERLSNISLQGNEPEIEWTRDDEFGKLVETYNFLIAKLRTSAELLERTSQEMAWKDMAKQVAHEIKNPLTPMRLTTQQIMRQLTSETVDKEKLYDYFKMILEQINTLNDIATSFSNFAHADQREGSCQDLFSILKTAIASYNEKDVEIVLENNTGQDMVHAFVSRSQMIQVFNNLIKNAIQAKKPDQKQHISLVLQNHGDKMWQIQLSDTGTGMTKEVKEKLFQPNFTTKTSGMGLGLAVVKQIVTSRGGNITFKSTLGKGTTFWIMLPKC